MGGLAAGFPNALLILMTSFSASKKRRIEELFAGMPNISVRARLPHVRMLGERFRTITALLAGLAWKRAGREVDIVHLTDPFGTAALPARFVATVNDLFPLTRAEYAGTDLRGFYSRRTPLLLRRALAVIVPSLYVRDSIHELFPKATVPVVTVPDAASEYFIPGEADPCLPEKLGLREEGFFLYVGRNDPRKNANRIIEAYSLLSENLRSAKKLVLVLSGGPGGEETLRAGFGGPEEAGGVVFLGSVDREELRALYRSAVSLVFPSLDEGFGLPVIEAMRSGCPVITSNCSCLPETAGGAAILVDPANTSDISRAMALLAASADTAELYRKRGLERAGGFSWRRTASETMEVYRSVLS